MTASTKNKRTVHLSKPLSDGRAMCGIHTKRVQVVQTDTPGKTTCKTCRKAYESGPKWFSAAKRRQTKAAKG